MRVQCNISRKKKEYASPFRFIANLKSYTQYEVEDLGSTDTKVDIDVRYITGLDVDRTVLRDRVYEMLGNTVFIFHISDLKIGEPMECSMCHGTGKSYYPNDILAKEK